MGEFQLCTRSRLCPRRKKAMVGEGEKKSKREPPPPFNIFPSFFTPAALRLYKAEEFVPQCKYGDEDGKR